MKVREDFKIMARPNRGLLAIVNLRLKLYNSPSRAWTWLFSSADWMTAKVPPCSVQASSPASQLLLEA